MGLKIAFCGPDRTLNMQLTTVASDLLLQKDIESILLDDPADIVAVRTGKTTFEDHDTDWLNLWSAVTRRMSIEVTDKDGWADISASCGIDEVCAQAAWLGEQIEHQQTGLSLVGADGQPLVGDQGVWINRSGAVLQTILNSTEEEVTGLWDFIYASVPDEKDTPLLIQYHDFLSTVPAFQGVIMIPFGLDIATSVLEIEADKWQTQPD